MAKRFGVGCAVLYVDEGGGFSDYCLVGPDGDAAEAGMPAGTSASKLGAACRRAAREGLAAMGAQAIPAKQARARAALWPALMAAGAEVSPAAFGEGAPEPGSPLAASLALWACSPGAASPGSQIAWLDELAARGVVAAGSELESGYALGTALVGSGWEAGARWALRTAAPGARLALARVGMLRAVDLNAPGAALAAWEALPEPERPDATIAGLGDAPETAAALAGAARGARRAEFAQAARAAMPSLEEWSARIGSFMPERAAERSASIAAARALLESLDVAESAAPAAPKPGGSRRF